LKNPRPKNFNPEKTAGLPYYTYTVPFWEIQCPQKPFFPPSFRIRKLEAHFSYTCEVQKTETPKLD